MHSNWIHALGLAGLATLASGAAQALPVISELYYDAVGSDDGESFVEIYGSPGTSLEGFAIDGVNGANGVVGPTITLTGTIGASGFFVVADRRTDGTSSVVGASLLANFDFQNGPDAIVLRSAQGAVDALAYGTFAATDINAGEGSAAPGVPAGSSLERRFANVDTDDNAADFVALAAPTPGAAPLSVVPEPGSALLLGLGLSGLAGAARRSAPTLPSRSLRSPLR